MYPDALHVSKDSNKHSFSIFKNSNKYCMAWRWQWVAGFMLWQRGTEQHPISSDTGPVEHPSPYVLPFKHLLPHRINSIILFQVFWTAKRQKCYYLWLSVAFSYYMGQEETQTKIIKDRASGRRHSLHDWGVGQWPPAGADAFRCVNSQMSEMPFKALKISDDLHWMKSRDMKSVQVFSGLHDGNSLSLCLPNCVVGFVAQIFLNHVFFESQS